ncbi:hypothetical protein GCM10022216_14390 [Sphingobacterium kyonggiense]|uniref:Peptidase S49 domain-containing protein n=1 Tax=Sphingobacterium kyonggiense TaxID=714075 RepID=A0ABP7YLC5_9SPHI
MQRRIEGNWQYHLLTAILKGQFMINPEMAMGFGAQISGLLNSKGIYQNDFQALNEINVLAYDEDGDQVPEDIAEEGSSVMVLPIKGTMFKYGTWCTYGMDEIAYYIKHFASKENVSAIVLDIDSGGGAVNAVPPLLDAIKFVKESNKPIIAHCDAACSAAYWTASACDYIFSNNNISSVFGSIGVMISFLDLMPYYEKQGAKFHEVYADQSADKNLAFQQLLKGEYDQIKAEMLNPMAIQFQESVKSYRESKIKLDTPGILSGATYPGQKSVDIGLADAIGTLQDAINYATVKSWANQ